MANEIKALADSQYRLYSYDDYKYWTHKGPNGTGDWRDGGLSGGDVTLYKAEDTEATGSKYCIRLTVNKDIVARLTGFSFQITVSDWNSKNATAKYRVYTTDPTVYTTTIPSNTISTGTFQVTGSDVKKTFTVSGINVSTEYIYILFTNAAYVSYGRVEIDSFSITNVTCTENPISMTVTMAQCTTGSSTQRIKFSNRAGRTLTIQQKYGNTLLYETTISATYEPSDGHYLYTGKEFFDTAGVTTQQSMTITVSVVGHSGTTSFTLIAGDDMKPTIGAITTSCVQPAPASANYPNTYLTGISKVKIEAAVTKNTNAAIRTVSAAIGTSETISLTYNSTTQKYEGTSTLPVAENFTVTVTATDVRSMSGTKNSSTVTVVQYVRPVINIDQAGTIRCNSQGQKDSGGAYYRAKATATYYSSLSGNKIVSFTVREENTATATAITSGTQSGIIQTNVASTARMTIVFTVTDYVGYSAEKTFIFDGSRVWIMWETPSDGNGLNLGIGKRPERILSGISTVDVDVNNGTNAAVLGFLLEGLNAGAFPMTADADLTGASFNKNFLNVDTSARIRKENAAEWFTKPSSDSAWSGFPTAMSGSEWRGLRMVFIIGSSSVMVMVLEAYPTPGRMWFRYKASSSWTSWYKLTPTT